MSILPKLLASTLSDDRYVLQVPSASFNSADLEFLFKLIPVNVPRPVVTSNGKHIILSEPKAWSHWRLRGTEVPQLIGGSEAGTPHVYRRTTERPAARPSSPPF